MNWAQAERLDHGDHLRLRESLRIDELGDLPAGTVLLFQTVLDLPTDKCQWVDGSEQRTYRHLHVCLLQLPSGAATDVLNTAPRHWRAGAHGGFYVCSDGISALEKVET